MSIEDISSLVQADETKKDNKLQTRKFLDLAQDKNVAEPPR